MKESYRQDGAKVFLAVLGDITRKNGHRLQTERFKWDLTKLMQYWSRLPTEVVKYPSLVALRT